MTKALSISIQFKPRSLIKMINSFYLRNIESIAYSKRKKDRLPLFLSVATADTERLLPIASFDTRLSTTCKSMLCHQASCSFESYAPGASTSPHKTATLLVLDVRKYLNHTEYEQHLHQTSRKFYRDIRRAETAGFRASEFVLDNFTPDVVKIRRSTKIRSFGLVLEAFTLRVKDLGGPPVIKIQLPEVPQCSMHWEKYIGVFIDKPNHKQGDIQVDEELVAYVRILRSGNTLYYKEFIGHVDFIKNGIMMLLHNAVVKHVIELNRSTQAVIKPIDFIIYGALEHGSEGLVYWKRKALFYPHEVQIIRTPLPVDFKEEVYLKLNPDVAQSGVAPAWHYQHHGAREGRIYK
jgi:hypothetical protein